MVNLYLKIWMLSGSCHDIQGHNYSRLKVQWNQYYHRKESVSILCLISPAISIVISFAYW